MPTKPVPVFTLTGVPSPELSWIALLAMVVSVLDEDKVVGVPDPERIPIVESLEMSNFDFDVAVKLPVDAFNTKLPFAFQLESALLRKFPTVCAPIVVISPLLNRAFLSATKLIEADEDNL